MGDANCPETAVDVYDPSAVARASKAFMRKYGASPAQPPPAEAVVPQIVSCACELPGGEAETIMARRRNCMAAARNRTPCRCACHRPGVFHLDSEGNMRTTPEATAT